MFSQIAYTYKNLGNLKEVFAGRSSRSEYIPMALLVGVAIFIIVVISIFNHPVFNSNGPDLTESIVYQLASFVGLILALPFIAVTVRRLHDIGLSGWFILISFVPAVGWLLFVVLMVWPSKEQPAINATQPIAPPNNQTN